MITQEKRQKIFDLDLRGYSQKDIALALNLSTSCVNDNLIKYKGRKRSRRISNIVCRLLEAYELATKNGDYQTMTKIAIQIEEYEKGS